MDNVITSPPQQAALQFYDGMLQAATEARATVLPRITAHFASRGMQEIAEQAFSKVVYFQKRMQVTHNGLPCAPIAHGVQRSTLEFFCCLSALNLYRLPRYTEKFKVELFAESFYAHCEAEEMAWLGIYNASTPNFRRDTGHEPNHWRSDVIKTYLMELRAKSSRDADTFVAVRRFLERNQLSKGSGVAVTPAMLESCAETIEAQADWLEHYLKYHPL